MTDDNETPTADLALPELTVNTETGTIKYGDTIVGSVEMEAEEGEGVLQPAHRLVLNLGWLRRAGLAITLEPDPSLEHPRSGYVLQRP